MAEAQQDPWIAAGLIPAAAAQQPQNDPWAAAGLIPADSAPQTTTGPPAPGKGRTDPIQPTGLVARTQDAFTGASRTEFPDAIEFGPALMRGGVRPEDLERIGAFDLSGVHRSAITPDPNAQLDILRRNIPGLEAKQDRFGNVMLRAPQFGVTDWAYLNKPGLSGRDVDEFGTQTLATLPFLGAAGAGGNTVVGSAVRGGAALAGGEVAKDALAVAAGSEQGVDPVRAGVAGVVGGVTAPGVPTAIAGGALDTARRVTSPITNYVRSAASPRREASRRVAESYVADLAGPAGRLTPEQAQHSAANRLQIADAHQGLDQFPGGESRLMDIGGTRTRALARSAANNSPDARGTLEGVINPRFETQSERTGQFLDALLPGPTAQQSREALQEMAYTARAPFYEVAYRDGSEGVMTTALARISQAPAVTRAMERAADALQNKAAAARLVTAAHGPRGPTLEFWDQVKRNLNDEFNALSGQGRNAAAADIAGILDRLVGALDTAVPSYNQARGVAMGLFRANNALEAGENFVTSRLSNDAAERAIQQMNPMERDLFSRGFVSRFIASVHEAGDRRNLMNAIVNSPAARTRLEIALGPHRARELEAFVRAERVLDLARTAVQGNSTTARQLMELGLAGTAGAAVSGFDPTNPVAWLVAILTKQGARRMHTAIDTRVANEVAEMLVSRDPEIMRRGLQRISNGPMLRALRDFDRRTSGAGRGAAMAQTADAITADRQPEPTNVMAGPPSTNAMAPQQTGTQENPVPVRSRADVQRVPPGAFVVDESGQVYQRR